MSFTIIGYEVGLVELNNGFFPPKLNPEFPTDPIQGMGNDGEFSIKVEHVRQYRMSSSPDLQDGE